MMDECLKVLVGGEALARSFKQSIFQTESLGRKIVQIRNVGHRAVDYRDSYYEIQITGQSPSVPESFWDKVEVLVLFDTQAFDVEKLVGSLL
jgi:hypothetical protein